MASFQPNPNFEDDPWIERPAIEGGIFRIWHVIFFCFIGFATLVILTCCCIKIRVPRTKQDIEADFQRKKLASKFKERLKLIQNQEMDALDLQQALEIIQQDYKTETRNLNEQMFPDYNLQLSDSVTKNLMAEPQQPNAARMAKLMALVKLKKMQQQASQNSQVQF